MADIADLKNALDQTCDINAIPQNIDILDLDPSQIAYASNSGVIVTKTGKNEITLSGTSNRRFYININFYDHGLVAINARPLYFLIKRSDGLVDASDCRLKLTYFNEAGTAVDSTDYITTFNTVVNYSYPSAAKFMRNYLIVESGVTFTNVKFEFIVTETKLLPDRNAETMEAIGAIRAVISESIENMLETNEAPLNIGALFITDGDISYASSHGITVTRVDHNKFKLDGTATAKLVIDLDYDSDHNIGLIDIEHNPVYFSLNRSDGDNDAYDSYLHLDYFDESGSSVGTASVISRFNEVIQHTYPSAAKKFRTYFVIYNGSHFDNVTFEYCVYYAVPLKNRLAEIQKKTPYPLSNGSPDYGTYGQVLSSNGDGTTRWKDEITPTPEVVEAAVETWINENPETVAALIGGWYVTPEMFGAYGDGVHDDTDALIACFASEHPIFSDKKTYLTSRSIPLYGFEKIVNFYGNIIYTGTDAAFVFDESDPNVRLSDSYIFINDVRAPNGECFLMKPKNGNSNYVAGVVFKFGYLAASTNKNIFHVQCLNDGWFNEITFEYGNWANGDQAFFAEAMDVTSNDLHLIRFHYCHMEGTANAIKVSLNNTPACLLIDNCRLIEIRGKYLEITGTPRGNFRGATFFMPHEIPEGKIVTPSGVSVHIV